MRDFSRTLKINSPYPRRLRQEADQISRWLQSVQIGRWIDPDRSTTPKNSRTVLGDWGLLLDRLSLLSWEMVEDRSRSRIHYSTRQRVKALGNSLHSLLRVPACAYKSKKRGGGRAALWQGRRGGGALLHQCSPLHSVLQPPIYNIVCTMQMEQTTQTPQTSASQPGKLLHRVLCAVTQLSNSPPSKK